MLQKRGSGKNPSDISPFLFPPTRASDYIHILSMMEKPSVIATRVLIKEAIKLKASLEQAGAVVEFTNIKPSSYGVRDH
jgi:hypothetical protein